MTTLLRIELTALNVTLFSPAFASSGMMHDHGSASDETPGGSVTEVERPQS